MTYLAPRQGRFAVSVLIIFCLHILLFVVSAEQQARKKETQIAITTAKQLTQELKMPLSANDRVSAAVVASRYEANDAIAYIGVYNAQEELIVPIGNDLKVQGNEIVITDGTAVLGRAVIKTVPISRAGIIAEHWLFVLGALVLHAMLWMIYGYVARPSKRLLDKIYNDTRDRLLSQGILAQDVPKENQLIKVKKATDTTDLANTTSVAPFKPKTIQSFLQANLHTNDHAKQMVVQVAFLDKNNLFDVLDPKKAEDYFALYNELLDKTVKKVLNTTQCQGVAMGEMTLFGRSGASVVLYKQSPTANVALAAALTTKLFVLVNHVVYDRLRESAHFALHVKAIATDDARKQIGKQILNRREETSLLLLPKKDKEVLSDTLTLTPIAALTDGIQKECFAITQANEAMTQLLVELRRQVLS